MGLDIVKGRASNVSLGSDYSYAATANHGPVAIKNQIVSMRVEGKPVEFKTRSLPSISDGDEVVAAGSTKNGTLQAVAMRNVSTGASYFPPTTMPLVLGALLIVIGIPLIPLLGIGLFFGGFGAWVIYKCLNVRKAVKALA